MSEKQLNVLDAWVKAGPRFGIHEQGPDRFRRGDDLKLVREMDRAPAGNHVFRPIDHFESAPVALPQPFFGTADFHNFGFQLLFAAFYLKSAISELLLRLIFGRVAGFRNGVNTRYGKLRAGHDQVVIDDAPAAINHPLRATDPQSGGLELLLRPPVFGLLRFGVML
jgi:hypothetical protein